MIYKSSNLENLQAVIFKIKNKTFSLETQYKFLKILKVIEPELEIYNEQKALLIEQYAARNEDGSYVQDVNGIKIDPSRAVECQKRIEELNAMEISFHDIYFKLEEFIGLDLTLEDLMYLDPFVKQ